MDTNNVANGKRTKEKHLPQIKVRKYFVGQTTFKISFAKNARISKEGKNSK